MPKNVLDLFSKPTAEWFQNTFGEPTRVQKQAWAEIAAGRPVLVSAPTGTGKTLSAFLIFIDQLMREAQEGSLQEGLQLIYVSPLKSLAADIRENLRRPLDGILAGKGGGEEISVAIRTGDTTQQDRRRMIKHPPHILITTPESLFLLLTSASGQSMLKTARAVVIDELHALIDTKRGAHLLFSIARLDKLCGRKLQRIGLSATIEPLLLAAEWLSPEKAAIVAPVMEKKTEITVAGTTPAAGRRKDPVWEELARKVYERCDKKRSVIAFSEGRRYAEKLAYYVNQIAGEEFARVHHGSLSKEQRFEVENALREGKLRLLCATSSMELGIDVGEIDEVLQIGCPRTVSSAMQRLGRAGHNPGRVSVMQMYPRTAPEGLFCGMTAALALKGCVEEAHPPGKCLDVLAQHLVSMAAGGQKRAADAAVFDRGKDAAYTVDDVLALTKRAWPFSEVTKETVKRLLCMLAGDYEHNREIPVRPRILYDRIHELVYPDPYSRMLAVAAGGTIPDKGLYAAKTLEGVKLGELDEEFVYESYVGDRFLLGSFGWRIVGQDKDTVYVEPASADAARIPFWKGELKGRSLKTGLAFGKMLSALEKAADDRMRLKMLADMGLDHAAAQNAADFISRQIAATGCLPDDQTIIAEHFCDHTGCHQVMLHSMFGRRINAPLAVLLRDTLQEKYHMNVGCVDEEDGILLYPYGVEKMPEGILQSIDLETAAAVLEAALPQAPIFGMTFRYNAARALMMGMRRNGRQPLWMQRLRSTEMLDSLISEKAHPLIEETRRECLEDLWDLKGLMWLLSGIRSGLIGVREVYTQTPSPMSLPLQWQTEAAQMYEYSPSTPGIRQAGWEERKLIEGIKPSREELEKVQERRKMPQTAAGLHSLLMMEGDMEAGEIIRMEQEATRQEREAVETKRPEAAGLWLEELARAGQALYIEPGLWIAAEQRQEYEEALGWLNPGSLWEHSPQESKMEEPKECGQQAEESAVHILRRMLYYRGPAGIEQICARYFAEKERVQKALARLIRAEDVVEDGGVFYHARLYERAQKATIRGLRSEAVTQPAERYAALMAKRVRITASAAEQLKETLRLYCGMAFPASFWEEVLFAARVKNYREALLDSLLAEGDFFWHFLPDGRLCFERAEDADWETAFAEEGKGPAATQGQSAIVAGLSENERRIYEQLQKRGASFLKQLARCIEDGSAQDALLSLAQKGLVCADSFVPVRQLMNADKIAKATVRQKVSARVQAMSAGRWDLVRPCQKRTMEMWLERLFMQKLIVCRETFMKPETDLDAESAAALSWSAALEVLRSWEYTGRVRRGYFVEGMSGAQFIRREDYAFVTQALTAAPDEVIWLNGADPACVWGKALPHQEGRGFQGIVSTATALKSGRVIALLERKGRVLKVFEEECLETLLGELVLAFRSRRLFPGTKRIVMKEYPQQAAAYLKRAGFVREMQDYVLYLS